MDTTRYRPDSMGAQLWGSGPGNQAPIAIPPEIALAAARPRLEDSSHPFIAAAVVAVVAAVALLAYAFV